MTQSATRSIPLDHSLPPAGQERIPLTYRIGKAFGRFTFFCTMNVHALHTDIPHRPGPFILALTHLSNLEPFCAGVLLDRKIDWMTRKEFFKYRPIAWLLYKLDCFKVNRQGICVSAVRTAIARLRAGRLVGICPEGGVVRGQNAAIRGGSIKRGVCSASIRTGSPIIPAVYLGTHKFNQVAPWLPFRRAHLYVIYGQPILPQANRSTRETRLELSNQLRQAYQDLYHELCHHYNISDSDIP